MCCRACSVCKPPTAQASQVWTWSRTTLTQRVGPVGLPPSPGHSARTVAAINDGSDRSHIFRHRGHLPPSVRCPRLERRGRQRRPGRELYRAPAQGLACADPQPRHRVLPIQREVGPSAHPPRELVQGGAVRHLERISVAHLQVEYKDLVTLCGTLVLYSVH